MYSRPAFPSLPIASLTLASLFLAACSGGEQHGGGWPPAAVSVVKVAPHDVPVSYTFVGQTEGSREVEVRAQVGGILLQRHYQEGATVKAGATLFTIDPATYQAALAQAEAEVAAAQAHLSQSTREVARLKPLFAEKAVSQKEYDDAVSAEELNRANLALARARATQARLNAGYSSVRAPISGIAGRAQKSEGNLIAPGADSLLTTLVQTDPMYVHFNLPDSEQARLKQLAASGALKMPADGKFAVELTLGDGSAYARRGSVDFAETGINLETGSVRTRATFANPDGQLLPGQFVRVNLVGAVRPQAITVPQRAVADGPMGKFVYLAGKGQDGKPAAVVQPVVVGEWTTVKGQREWVIQKGLKTGDAVIVEGLAKLRPGAPIAVGAPGAPSAPAAAGAAHKS